MADNDLHENTESREIVRYVRLKNLMVYEISEDELQNLEKGSPAPVMLSFALFLLGIAITATITLFTTTTSAKTFTFFTILTVAGYLLGILSLIVAGVQIFRAKAVGKSIRSRANDTQTLQQDEGE